MKIVVDTREQRPFRFERWPAVILEPGTLPTGDYSLPGLAHRVALERKSLDDLVGCLKSTGRERFERELARARGMDLFAVVIEAGLQDVTAHKYHSHMTPKAIIESINAFTVRHHVPFLFCGDRAHAEGMVYSLLSKFIAERQKELKNLLACQEAAA